MSWGKIQNFVRAEDSLGGVLTGGDPGNKRLMAKGEFSRRESDLRSDVWESKNHRMLFDTAQIGKFYEDINRLV